MNDFRSYAVCLNSNNFSLRKINYLDYFLFSIMIKATVIIIISLYSLELSGQTFHTGQFSIPRIVPGYDLFEHDDSHPSRREMMHLVLQDNKISVINMDTNGNIKNREVYDFEANTYYVVGKLEDKWIYYKDSIPDNASFYNNQNLILSLYYKGLVVAPEKVNYKGFSCYTMQMFSKKYGKVTMLATDQIIIPSKNYYPRHKLSLLDSVVILKSFFEYEDLKLNASIDTFYTDIQNPEWLIPSQEGAITYIEKQKIELKHLLQTTYNNQVNKGENLDIGIALYDHGLLSESDIKSRIEDNDNVDKLFWMNKTEYLSRSITYDSLIKMWIKDGLISPALNKQIVRYKMEKWKESRETFFSMMSVLMLNEMVSERKNRETIIANMSLDGYRFKQGSEKTKTDFLNGQVDVSSIFLAVDGIYPIPPFYKTKDKSKIEKEVQNLLVQIFPILAGELKVWITLDSSSRRLHVSTDKFQYQAEVYREYDGDEEAEVRNLKKLNEFSFDSEFLSDLEKVLKQIGTDYQNNKIFGFRSFSDNLTDLQTGDYELLTKKHPELSLFKSLWYVGALDRNFADWSADIKITYRNTDMAHYQSQFLSLYLCSSFAEYLPSERKKNVIEFMRRYQEDLNLSDEVILTREENLQSELIELNDNLGRFIPGIQYRISRMPDEFLNQIPSNTSFSNFFPGLYAFIRQDFNPMLMGLSDDASKMYWKDESGKLDTVPMNFNSTEESILAFLNKKLKPTGYGIYTIPSFRLTEKEYYYLTQQQKKELEIILGGRLVEIK